MQSNETEREFTDNVNLISTTTPSSIITHANAVFCDIAEYDVNEMLDKPHNIVRHPDMPKAAFKQLWDTIKSNNSWMGLVKNTTKNGNFYWVSAFVTPITDDQNNITEYQSVRSKPKREWVKRAEILYALINKNKLPIKLKYPRFSFSLVRILASSSIALSSIAIMLGYSPVLFSSLSIASVVSIAINGFVHRKRLDTIMKTASDINNNSLMEYVYTGYHDEYSIIELALHKRTAEIRAIVGRSTETVTSVHSDAEKNLVGSEDIKINLSKQEIETDSVATAITEMSHSIQDVASNATDSSKVIKQIHELSNQGKVNVETTIESIANLRQQLTIAINIIYELSENSQRIESILDVIESIADQTNLLALNAAIEAARAGDAGRGFAVVADEVRQLAIKTQSSTEEIQSMISLLQDTARSAVDAMDQGGKLADACNNNAVDTGSVLEKVNLMLDTANDSSHQIASAVQQQAAVAEEASSNINSIQYLAKANHKLSDNSVNLTIELVKKLEDLQRLMTQFQKN